MWRRTVALGLVAGLALTACSDAEPEPTPAKPTATVSLPPEGYPSGAPIGAPYTVPGTDLALKKSAIVAWQTTAGRPASGGAGESSSPGASPSSTATSAPTPTGSSTPTVSGSTSPSDSAVVSAVAPKVALIAIRVNQIKKTSFKRSFQDWKVRKGLKEYVPYFVRARVRNLTGAGVKSGLGGRQVPLYIATADNRLVEPSTFSETFTPCAPHRLPKTLKPTEVADLCLVYLVPRETTVEGVAFRPTPEFLPITWSAQASTIGASATPSATIP